MIVMKPIFTAGMAMATPTPDEKPVAMPTAAASLKTRIDAEIAKAAPAWRAEGARAEKDRITAIFALEEAANRASAAKTVALTTSLSVEEAKNLLASLPVESAAGPTLFTRVN